MNKKFISALLFGALLFASTSTFVSCSYDEDITELRGELATLQSLVDSKEQEINKAIAALTTQADELKAKYDAALENLAAEDTKAQAEVAKIAASLALVESAIADLQAGLAAETATLREKDEELSVAIIAATAKADQALALIGDLEDVVEGLRTQTTTLSEDVKAIQESVQQNAAAIAAQKAIVDELSKWSENAKTELKNLNDAITAAQEAATQAINDAKSLIAGNTAAIEALQKTVADLKAEVAGIQDRLEKFNSDLAYEGKRLKSLVFAPTEYVDGIECIRFATLQYRAWTSLEADVAPTVLADNVPNPLIHIDDASKTLEYLVNPKNVIKNDITKLSFISNTASNTRAVSQSAPIEVKDFAITDGVMAVKITKTGTGSFGDNREDFTIVSLKATLSDKFLTEEEVKNGEKAEVYSDWARLYETSVTPYIHNVLTNNDDGSYNEGHANSHFWNFTTAYAGHASDANLPHDLNGKHIAKQVVYNQPIDLMTLVGVCDQNGKAYNAASYGLEFEFNLMTYQLLNNGSTTDATDQKKFAKLDGSVLTSTAANGEANNRDAIGRQPMIQVVLKDKANNKVVDVRYFKILWVANAPAAPSVKDFKMFGKFEEDYICNDDYSLNVLEQKVNDLYAFVGESGLSRDEFHNSYELCPDLFTSLDEIKKEEPIKNAYLGAIVERASGTGTGATYNYTWSVNTRDQKMTQAEYEVGKKVVTAYGYFYSKTDARDRIAFSLELTMNQSKIALKSGTGRDATMWKDGARYMNPALESDAAYGNAVFGTTQILGSLLQGYIRDGQTPVDVMDMINISSPDNAKFIFDIANTKGSWYVSADGLTLYYDINNDFNVDVPSYDASEIAATIHESTGKIQLKESNPGALDSEPTAAAKLLVGGKAPVKLYTEWCALTQILEKHDVNFLTPLEVSSQNIPVTLYDITAGGDSKATFAGKFVIKEKFTTNKRVVWSNKVNKTQEEIDLEDELVPWYGVKDPVFSTANAKTNIQPNGSIGSTCNTPLANLKNSDSTPKYTVSIVGDEVIFNNKSGNAIGQSFMIEIPVTVATKWQDVIEAKVVVTIMPAI